MSFSPTRQVRRRYDAIEAAYTSGDYAEVLSQGLNLLQDLEDPASQPLRMRLLLLLAHTWLYGLGDQDSAAVAYGQVAAESDEEDLQVIAAEGLRRISDTLAPLSTPQAEAGAMTESIDPIPERLEASAPIPTASAITSDTAGDTASLHQAPWANVTTNNPHPSTNLGAATSAPWLQDLDPRFSDEASNQGTVEAMNTSLLPIQQPLASADDTDRTSAPAAEWISDPVTTADLALTSATTATEPGPRSLAAEEITTQDVEVLPGAFRFNRDEEQELAKGLLLVVLG